MKKTFLLLLLFASISSLNADTCYQTCSLKKNANKQPLKFKIPCGIVDRATWGARSPRLTISDVFKAQGGYEAMSQYPDYGHEYQRVILHVTDMVYEDKFADNTDSWGCGPKQATYIQNNHMDTNKWADIGYNFLIDRCGNVYAGRPLVYVSSHAGETMNADGTSNTDVKKDPDYGSLGIAFIGRASELLTTAQVKAVEKLIAFHINCYNINKIVAHTEVKKQLEDGTFFVKPGEAPGPKLIPKGRYDATDCPGKGTMKDIIAIRRYFNKNYSISFDEDAYKKLFP